MRLPNTFLTFFFLFVSFTATANASSGDRAFLFQQCLTKCITEDCQDPTHPPPPLSLPLRLTRWTCEDNCKYDCMHGATEFALDQMHYGTDASARVEQFYGKWPFWRFLGMQEPASVLFSLMNLAAHYFGLKHVRRRIPEGHPMKQYIVIWGTLGLNTWVWSTIFHTRDTSFTEKLDYFSAAASIMYSVFLVIIRLLHFHTPRRQHLLKPWAQICGGIYLLHVTYLTLLPRFDYSYNIFFNAILAIIHNLAWCAYSFIPSIRLYPNRHVSYKPVHLMMPARFVLVMTLATLLELLDFPPFFRVIDAHSLWHLATAPIIVFWYRFLILDCSDEGWGGDKAV